MLESQQRQFTPAEAAKWTDMARLFSEQYVKFFAGQLSEGNYYAEMNSPPSDDDREYISKYGF